MLKRFSFFLLIAFVSGGLLSPAVAQIDKSPQQQGDLRKRINNGTVGIVSGGINGTYIRIASDLAAVLDEGNDLRVLPLIGEGSLQNITDALYLKGIDIGVVQSDVLEFVKREKTHSSIENRINFITKLYNEEFHLLVGDAITSIEQLNGKKVNVGSPAGGSSMTASIVFETLGIETEPTAFDQALALEKVKSGEIAGMVFIVGKPASLFDGVAATDGVHLLPIPYSPELLETYLPAKLTSQDYPGLVSDGQSVDTVAVGAVMAVYNWQPDTWRYQKVERFVGAFFSRFDEFLQEPRHPKWREVSLTAEVPGWNRFRPAREWLESNPLADTDLLRQDFQLFLQERGSAVVSQASSDADRDALFEQFLVWQKQQQ